MQSHDKWVYPNQGSSKYYPMFNWIHNMTYRMHNCCQKIVLHSYWMLWSWHLVQFHSDIYLENKLSEDICCIMLLSYSQSKGKRILSSPKYPDQLWGPTSPLFKGDHSLFPQVKQLQLRCLINHSSPTSVNVKDGWGYTSTCPLCPHGMDRDNFTFVSNKKLHYGQLVHEFLFTLHQTIQY